MLTCFFFLSLHFKESPSPRANGDHAVDSRDSIGLNGNDKPGGSNSKPSAERPPSRSGSSSSRSTPSLKTKDVRMPYNPFFNDLICITNLSNLTTFSWRNRELPVQRLDRRHQMRLVLQLVQNHRYLLAIHHRIIDCKIRIGHRLINMADRSIHMPMFVQMVYQSPHHIQQVENRK